MKILVAFAPSQDEKDRFFSTTPTSLGWALAPLIAEIDKGNIPDVEYVSRIYDPLRVHPEIWKEFMVLLEQERPDILLLSSTYDSHHSAIHLALLAKKFNSEVLVIYGGPHVDEVASANVIATMPQIYPFNESVCPFDILVKGDGDLILLALVQKFSERKGLVNFIEHLCTKDARADLACTPGDFEVHVRTISAEALVLKGSGIPLDLSQLPSMPRKLFGNDLDLYGFNCFREEQSNGTALLLPSTSTMLHPFMPFITEEIWRKLNNNGLIMVEKWPTDKI